MDYTRGDYHPDTPDAPGTKPRAALASGLQRAASGAARLLGAGKKKQGQWGLAGHRAGMRLGSKLFGVPHGYKRGGKVYGCV